MQQHAIRERVAANLARVRARIAAAAERAHRDPGAVRLVAVTKSVGPDVIRALASCGVTDCGENRVQQLIERAEALGGVPAEAVPPAAPNGAPSTPPIRWHMIGHLQRNKVRPLLRHCRIVHSVDSLRLADELEREAAALNTVVDVLIEVNVAGEVQKHGVSLDEYPDLLFHADRAKHLKLRGLMALAPLGGDEPTIRDCFQRLRTLLQRRVEKCEISADCAELSMGMSQDFEIAVEEGATMVRIGSTLFEGLAADA